MTFFKITSNVFSIVKVAVFLKSTGNLRKIMAFLIKITVCPSLLPPQINQSISSRTIYCVPIKLI